MKSISSLLCALSSIVLLTGCGQGPETFPVRGKVVYKDGTPWTGGTIQFTSVEHEEVSATGEIKEDGTFTLETHFAVSGGTSARTKPGAIPGAHNVYVDLPEPQVEKGAIVIKPVIVSQKFTVERRENDFTIEAQPSK